MRRFAIAFLLLPFAVLAHEPPIATPADAAAAATRTLANVRTPAANVTTSGRIAADDVKRLADGGVRRVVNLAPASETPGFDEAAAVRAAGMRYDALPIRGPDDLTIDNVRAFDRLLADTSQPTLVHCASGNRVGALAALRAAWIDGADPEAALAVGRAWGLAGMEPAVRAKLDAGP